MKNLRSNLIHSGVVSLNKLRGLSLFAALALLTACGGGGGGSSGGSSSSAYWLPYSLSLSGTRSLHLVNTRTLADKVQATDYSSVDLYFPYQVEDNGRLVALPASHVFYYDATRSRFVRKSLKGGGTFDFEEGCNDLDGNFGDWRPSHPWALLDCSGTNRLVNLLATSGNGEVSEVDLSSMDLYPLAGTWDADGTPSGFIAVRRMAGESKMALYRYRSDDWNNPEQLLDTDGNPVTADGFLPPELSMVDYPLSINGAGWIVAVNGTAGVMYRAIWNGSHPVLEALPAEVDLSDASGTRLSNGDLYYVRTSSGVPSLYKLYKPVSIPPLPIQETQFASASAGSSISIRGFTPTHVIWLDTKDGDHAILKSSTTQAPLVTSELWNHDSSDKIVRVYVDNEKVYFSVLSSDGLANSYRINSDGSNRASLGEGVLFRADFANLNGGTSQDDGRIYLANVTDYVGSDIVLTSGKLNDEADAFITLGTASGYNSSYCEDEELRWGNPSMALTPAGKQLIDLYCSSSYGLFAFDPAKAGSLSVVQEPAGASSVIVLYPD